MNKYLTALFVLFIFGCATTNTPPYDSTGFNLSAPEGFNIKTELKTGKIGISHSYWIDAIDYSNGVLPVYTCIQNGPHWTGGSYWMYDLKDQELFMENLNKVLNSNSIYNEDSTNKLIVHFISVAQGPGDRAVYTFDVNISLIQNDKPSSTKNIKLVGNKSSEEFWKMDHGAKGRASNKLMSEVIAGTNEWLAMLETQ